MTLHVNGFKTPLTGPVNTQLGIVSYEGDLNLAGDSLALNGTTLSDAAHAPDNFFNSGISNLGAPVTASRPTTSTSSASTPACWRCPRAWSRTATPARTSLLKTVGDRYLPGVVYFRTDIYAPEMVLKKTVTDLNGGDVNPGDVLRYEISSTNTGVTSAYDTRINDAIPPHTTFVPSSLAIDSSPGVGIAGAKTDASDSDQAEYDASRTRCASASARARARPPGGALNPNGGGIIAPTESFSVRFDVVVGLTTPDGTQILNTAILSSKDENGIDYTSIASAPAGVIVHGVPDVTIDKSHTGTFVRGAQGTFNLVVSNVGGRATTAPVVIDDTLPPDLGLVSAAGDGWACAVTAATNSLHCDRADSLAVGAAFPPVTVLVNVLESAPDSVDQHRRHRRRRRDQHRQQPR